MRIEEIPARPKEPNVTRVAAYARVSSDKDAAFHSLEAQTEYYQNYIAAHPDCIKLFRHTPSFSLDSIYETFAEALQKSGTAAEVRPVHLPGLDDKRAVLYIKKTKKCPAKYPRKPKMAAKNPL